MRQIAIIADEAQARTFANYLLTRGTASRLQPDGSQWQIWILDEDRVASARDEYEAFRQDPRNPRYQNLEAHARAIRKEAARVERRHHDESYDVRYFWTARDLRRCPLTWILLILSVVITFATNFGRNEQLTRVLYIARYEILEPEASADTKPADDEYEIQGGARLRTSLHSGLARGEVWRLVTPIFLHFNWPHLFFDMYLLFALGSEIEVRRRSWRLGIIVLTAAVVSNVVHYQLSHDPSFGGMSGVDMALFGFIWMKGMYERELGLSLSQPTVLMILLYIAYAYLLRSEFPHSAHLTGLIVGMLFALLPLTWKSLRSSASADD
jgi:GlpG protein